MKKRLNLMKLNEEEIKSIKGGVCDCYLSPNCSCACRWQYEGGSSCEGNGGANSDGGLHSPDY